MKELSFPYFKGKYKNSFIEIDILNSKNKSKYKIGNKYIIRAKMNNRTLKKIPVQLLGIKAYTWETLDNKIAFGYMVYKRINPVFDPNNIKRTRCRKGDLMKFLMTRFHGKGFKGIGTKFQILRFKIIK